LLSGKTVSKTRFEIAGVSDITNHLVTDQINVWSSTSGSLREWVEAGLICIFIQPRILNEARVSSYIRAILRDDLFVFSRKKHLNV